MDCSIYDIFIFSDNVRILYSFCNVKKPIANYIKRAETSVVQIVFQAVFFEVRVYTIPASYRLSTWIRYLPGNLYLGQWLCLFTAIWLLKLNQCRINILIRNISLFKCLIYHNLLYHSLYIVLFADIFSTLESSLIYSLKALSLSDAS